MEKSDQRLSTIKRVCRVVCNIFPGFTTIEIVGEIQKDLNAQRINPEQFEVRILFMSMLNGIAWTKNGNSPHCISWEIAQKDFGEDIGHSSVLEMKSILQKVVIQYSDVQVRSTEEYWSENQEETLFFTADSGTSELMLRTIHSVNQLSIFGALSSWCDKLAEKMLGQTSLEVHKCISKVNDQFSKQLNRQEVGSLVQNQSRTEEAAGNCWRDHLQRFKMLDLDEQFWTNYEVIGTMDFDFSQHHAESIHYLVLIKILWSSFGYKKLQRSEQFLKSRLSVILTNMESKFTLPLHLETTPMFRGSYAEARAGMWMSYDTRIQNLLQKTVKKSIVEICKKFMHNNRLFNRELNAVHLMTTFLYLKESGKTLLTMSTATNMSCDTMSQNLLENWNVTKIAVTEKQMEQFIGDGHVRSWNLRSRSKEETRSLIVMKITSQAKGMIRWHTTTWCTSLFRCLKRWKFWMRRQRWTRKGRSSKRFQPGIWTKPRAPRRLFWKHKKRRRKSTLLHWWTSVTSRLRS